jgi:hypothetical protein
MAYEAIRLSRTLFAPQVFRNARGTTAPLGDFDLAQTAQKSTATITYGLRSLIRMIITARLVSNDRSTLQPITRAILNQSGEQMHGNRAIAMWTGDCGISIQINFKRIQLAIHAV